MMIFPLRISNVIKKPVRYSIASAQEKVIRCYESSHTPMQYIGSNKLLSLFHSMYLNDYVENTLLTRCIEEEFYRAQTECLNRLRK